jgi:hypothetical protein
MGFLYGEVLEERYRLGGQVGYAACQVLLAPDVEGDDAEVVRECGDLLEPAPASEA